MPEPEINEQGIFSRKDEEMPNEFDSQLLAQQISELSQTVSQIAATVSKLVQTQAQTVGAAQVSSQVRMDDVGGSENLESNLIFDTENIRANKKRTYDAYLGVELEAIGRNRTHYDTMISRAQAHYDALGTISEQALENMVASGNQVNNQSINHRDLAVDRQWNVDETSYVVEAILRTDVFKEAIAAAVAATAQSNE